MSDNFHKFLFLGVMILIAVFANQDAVLNQSANVADGNTNGVLRDTETPIFILEPPAPTENDLSKKSLPTSLPFGITTESASLLEASSYSGNTELILDSSAGFLQSASNVGQSTFQRSGNESPPEIEATVALVADLDSKETFFGLETERRWPMASITKLMSAVIVSRNVAMNQAITLVAGDFPLDSSENGLKEGDAYVVGDLMQAMLLKSSNESAEAIARFYGRNRFISAMNTQAADWELKYSHFSDPTGLSASNQSTARDLLELANRIYGQNPEILETTKKTSSGIVELNSQKSSIIRNINLFAGTAGFLGGKTGYTDEASGNLLSIFSYNRRPVAVIVLGTVDRFRDTEKLFNWFRRNYE